MGNELIVRQTREMGGIITDSFRFIFRNLKPVSYLLAIYVFLPFTFAFLGLLLIQDNVVDLNETQLIIGAILAVIFGFISFAHLGLTSFSLLKSGQEMDANELDVETVTRVFKSLYLRNLGFISITTVLLIAIFALIGLFSYLLIGLGIFLGVIFALFFGFYIYPLLMYAYRLYLETPGLSYIDSISNGKEYIDSFWGSTIGLYFVSGIVSNFVQYSFVIPFTILTLLLATVYPIDNPDSMLSNPIVITQYAFMALGLSYLALFTYLCMFLKSYDIEERKYGTNKLKLIEGIGLTKESFFDNEGSY